MHARMMGTIRKHPTSTLEEESKYYGVSWDGVKEQWKATVQVAPGSAQTVCFWYPTAVKAAACYDCAQHELFRIHKQPVVFNYIQYPDDFAPGSWRAITGPVQQKLHEKRSVIASNKSQQLADSPAPTVHPAPARPPLVTATTSTHAMLPPIVRHSSSIMQPPHQPQHNLSHQRPLPTNAPAGSAMPTTFEQKPISPTAASGTPSAARGGKKLWAPGAKERRPVQLIDRNDVIAVSKVPLAQQPAPAAQPKPTGVIKTPRLRGRPKGSKSRTPSTPHLRTFKTTPRVTPGVEQHKSLQERTLKTTPRVTPGAEQTKLPQEKPSMAQLLSSKFKLPSFKKQPNAKAEAAPSTADQRLVRKDPNNPMDACEDGVPSLGDELSDMDIDGDSGFTAPSTVPAQVLSKRIPDTKTQVSAGKVRPPKLQIDRMCETPQPDNGRQLTKASLPPANPILHDVTPARVPSVASELHTPQNVVASACPAKSTATIALLLPAKPISHDATSLGVPAVALELHTPQSQVASAGPARTAAANTPETPAQTPAHASAYDNEKAQLSRSATGDITPVASKLGNSLASPQHAMEARPASRPGSACNIAPLPAAAKQSAMTSTATTALVITSSEEAYSTSTTTSTSTSASSSSDNSRVAEEVTSRQVATVAEPAAVKPAQEALVASPTIDKPDCAQFSDAPDSIIRIKSGPAAGKCYALNFTRKGTRVVGICSSEKEAKTPSSALKAQHHPPTYALSLSEESAFASEQWSESDAPSEVMSSPQHSDHSLELEGDSGERVLLPQNDNVIMEVGAAEADVCAAQPRTTLAVDLQAAEMERTGDESNCIRSKETAHALKSITVVLEATVHPGEPVKGERTTQSCAMQRLLAVKGEHIEQEPKTAELKDTGLNESNDASRTLLKAVLAEPLASGVSWCTGHEVREQPGNMQDDAKDSVVPAHAGSSPVSAATSEHKCDAPPTAVAAGALEIAALHPTSQALASADRVERILLEALDCARKHSANTTTSPNEDMPASPAPEVQQERMQFDAVATLDESEVRMHTACSVSRNIRVESEADVNDFSPASSHVHVERMEEEVVVLHANKVTMSSSTPESTQPDVIANMDGSTVRMHNTCSVSCDIRVNSEVDADVCSTPTSPHVQHMEEAVEVLSQRTYKINLSSSAQESTQPDAIANLDESTVRMQNMCSVSRDVDVNSEDDADVCPMPTPSHVDVKRMEEEVAAMREHAHSCISNSPAHGSTQPIAAAIVDKSELCGQKARSVSREDGVHAEVDADFSSTPASPHVNGKGMEAGIAVMPRHAENCSLSSLAQGSMQPNNVATVDESGVRMQNTCSVSGEEEVNAEAETMAATPHIEAERTEEEVPTISGDTSKRSSSGLSAQPLDRRKRPKLGLDLNTKVVEDMGEQALQPDGATHTMADIQSDGQHGDSLMVEASSSEGTERLASEATEATEVLPTPEDDGNAFTSPFAGKQESLPCFRGAGLNNEVDSQLYADASKGDDTSLATPPINNSLLDGVASDVMDIDDRINNGARALQSASVLPPKAGYYHHKGMAKGYTYEVRGNIWRATFNHEQLGSSPVFKNSIQAELGYLLGLAAIDLFEDLTMRKQFVRKAFDVVPDCLDDIPAADASSSSMAACIELQGRRTDLGKVLSVNETDRVICHWQRRQERDTQHVEPVDRAALGKAQPCINGKRPRGRPRKDGTISGPRFSYADVDRNPSLRPYYECSVATQLLQLLTEEAKRLGWTLPPDL
eukprot:jgi/Chlat1/6111/Chrsp402S05652